MKKCKVICVYRINKDHYYNIKAMLIMGRNGSIHELVNDFNNQYPYNYHSCQSMTEDCVNLAYKNGYKVDSWHDGDFQRFGVNLIDGMTGECNYAAMARQED